MGPTDWDYLIVSDGSGTVISKPCGWCGVLIRRSATFERKFFYGAMNTGTNIVAEMQGFVQPMLWLSCQKNRKRPAKIHVLTDCEVIKNIGTRKASRKSNKPLWYFIEALVRQLGTVEYHWLPRESTTLNRFADRLAGAARMLLLEDREREIIEQLGLEGAENIHDLNPS